GEAPVARPEVARVAWAIPAEIADEAEEEEVRHRGARRAALDDGGDDAVGRVRPAAVEPPAPHRRVGRRRVGRRQGRALEDPEVVSHLADDANLVAVLEVLADAGEVDDDLDAVALELGARTDAGEHQELRAVEDAAAEDDLAPGPDDAPLARVVAR